MFCEFLYTKTLITINYITLKIELQEKSSLSAAERGKLDCLNKFISQLRFFSGKLEGQHTKTLIFQSRNRAASCSDINSIPHLPAKVKEKHKNREFSPEDFNFRADMETHPYKL